MASAKQKTGKTSGQAETDKADDDKGGANRRKFHRRDTHIIAQLNYNGLLVGGMVTNLSLEGCLFAPRVDIPVGERVKLKLAGENKAVTATVKAVSELGVHCLLHAGGATLGRLSVEVDDMALLMLNASRPHEVEPAPTAAKPAATRQSATKKKAAKKVVKKAAKQKPAPPKAKPAPKKKAATKKKVVKKKVAAKKSAAVKKTAKKRRK